MADAVLKYGLTAGFWCSLQFSQKKFFDLSTSSMKKVGSGGEKQGGEKDDIGHSGHKRR